MANGVIICVDDERVVLNGLQSQLIRDFGSQYSIELAESGEEALDLIRELLSAGNDIPIVISDQMMPGIKGHDLLKRIHQMSPSTYTVLLTGQSDLEAVTEAVNHANLYRYIAKPWEGNDLIMTVREAIKGFYQEIQLEEQYKLLERHNKELEQLVEERTQELIKAEKMVALSIVATRLSHEILNPLNFVTNFSVISKELVEELIKSTDEANKKEITELLSDYLNKINDHSQRAEAIVKQLQEMSKKGNAQDFF